MIDEQLKIQRNRLLAACEQKVISLEQLELAEKEIREARMGVAVLEFALQQINTPTPAPEQPPTAEPEPPSAEAPPTAAEVAP